MEFSNFNEWYNGLKTLTQNDYEQAKLKAAKVIEKRIGDKPTKDEFKRETKSLITPITVLLFIVFIATWAVSSIEQIRFMGHEAFTFSQSVVEYIGLPLDYKIVAYVFQIGIVTITEFSMILFMIQWRINTKENNYSFSSKNKLTNNVTNWLKQFFNINFFLAILSMIIVLYINITSGMFILLGIAIPLFTIGLGLGFEEIVSEIMIERERIQNEYNKESNLWQIVNKDPEKHPQWKSVLYQSIWDSIVSKNNRYNKDYNLDVIGAWKAMAVENELERDEWSTDRVLKQQVVQQASGGISIEDLQGKNELEVLLTMVDNWNQKMNPIIKTENYTVNMNTLTYESEFEEPQTFSSVGYLRRRIMNNINKNK